jgi:hypothetical protein
VPNQLTDCRRVKIKELHIGMVWNDSTGNDCFVGIVGIGNKLKFSNY